MAEETPARRRRSDAERNGRRIVEAAMRVLADDPRASMQTVARESGLGRATVYRHFPTREVLAGAIYRQSLDDAQEAIRVALSSASDTRDAIDRLTLALVINGERYRMVVDRASTDPAMRPREEEVGAPMIALMEQGQRDGLLRADADVRWLTMTYTAILLSAVREADEISEEELAAKIVSTWLDGATRR